MATVLNFARANWSTIAALILAIVGVLWPASSPAVERFLQVFAAVFIAMGVGSTSARLAVRREARRLGLAPRD